MLGLDVKRMLMDKEKLFAKMKEYVFLLIIIIMNGVSICNNWLNQYLRTVIFTVSELAVLMLMIRQYKKKKEINLKYIIFINGVAIINMCLADEIVYLKQCLLVIQIIVYLVLIICGLKILWLAKTRIKKKMVLIILCSFMTIVINFGGFYQSFYQMYSPYRYGCFEINQDRPYEQSIMCEDFIYYSADVFFSTNLSDVSVHYIDRENSEQRFFDKYESADMVVHIVKFASFMESALFIVYISIILFGDSDSMNDEN